MEPDLIMEPGQSSLELWTVAESVFRDNKETRAIYLQAEFNSLVQGDLPITAYCQRLKTLADALCDIGHAVANSILVLNTLRGLNSKFSDVASIIGKTTLFPSFV